MILFCIVYSLSQCFQIVPQTANIQKRTYTYAKAVCKHLSSLSSYFVLRRLLDFNHKCLREDSRENSLLR